MTARKDKKRHIRRRSLIDTLAKEAESIIRAGDRLTIPSDLFEDTDHIQSFLAELAGRLGENVRASSSHGLLVIYPDGPESDGLGITVGIKR